MISIQHDPLMTKWVNLKMRDGGDLIDRTEAIRAYTLHPDACRFVMDHHLHKAAARFGDKIEISSDGYPLIKWFGSPVSAETIRSITKTGEGGELYTCDGERLYYRQEAGVTLYDPENWDQLPIFTTGNQMPHPGYWVTISSLFDDMPTASKFNPEKHTSLELTDPSGNTRSVGMFWKRGDSIEYGSLCQTLGARLHAPDLHEFTGFESITNKLNIALSQDEFERLVKKIEDDQANAKGKQFNLIDKNCTTWTKEILREVGIELPPPVGVMEAYGRAWKTDHYWPPFKQAASVIKKCLCIIRNLGLYLLGGNRSKDPVNDHRIFKSFWEVFDYKKGLSDHPRTVVQWIDKVNRERGAGNWGKPDPKWLPKVDYHF